MPDANRDNGRGRVPDVHAAARADAAGAGIPAESRPRVTGIKPYRLRERPCGNCGEIKPPTDYWWSAYTTNQGKRSLRRNKWCKDCSRARRPERREKEIESCKRWRAENREYTLAWQAQYRASENGKRRRSIAQAAREARKKAASDGRESPEILDMYQRAKQLEAKLAACVECDDWKEMKIHVDHIIPLSKGGRHHISNLQLLSARENITKRDRV